MKISPIGHAQNVPGMRRTEPGACRATLALLPDLRLESMSILTYILIL